METAQDANLTTTDIQTRRDTLSPALPHPNTVLQQGPSLQFLPWQGWGVFCCEEEVQLAPAPHDTTAPKNYLGKTVSDTRAKSILCFQCLLRCEEGKRRPPF